MLIEEVRLSDVKSYDEETVELEPGVNAVLGENGAGKSTIIEAIGFALFDSLPYRRQEDFVRRGETTGTVEVTLRMNGERCRVVRKCGQNASQHYVVRNGNRAVDGHRDVVDWLRGELGGTDLADLFSQVVGVPQGTFTAAFSETKRNREKLFQPLLGVDEYSRAYQRLRDPLSDLSEELQELGEREATLRERAGGRDAVQERIDALETELEEARDWATDLDGRVEELTEAKRELEERKEAVAERRRELADARNDLKSLESSLRDAEDALEEAEEAAERAAELRDAAERYDALDEEVQRLESDADRQRRIAERLTEARGRRKTLTQRVSDLEETVEEGEKAEAEIPALEERVEALEEAEDRLRDLKARGKSLRDRLDMLKERRNRVEEGGRCPLIEDTECPAVEDLDSYFETRIGETREELERTRERFEAARGEKEGLGDPRSELRARRTSVEEKREAEESLAEAREALREVDEEVEELEEERDGSVLDRLEEAREERKKLADEKERYIKFSGLAEKRGEREEKAESLRDRVEEAEDAVGEAEDALEAAEEAFDEDRYGAVTEELEGAKEERSRLRATAKQVSERLDEKREELARKEEAAEELRGVREEMAEAEELRETLSAVRGAIRDAAPFVSREIVDHVEAEADEIFSSIMGDATQRLVWDDTYLVTVRESGREKEFNQLSGGEQMAAALSVRLALTRVLSRAGVVFLDEPTQNMDAERRRWLAEKIVDVEGFDQILVVSHDDSFDSLTENVLRVTKDDASTVTEGEL